VSDTVESVTYDRAGVLVVQYAGFVGRDRIQLKPAVRPTAKTVILEWDPRKGVVIHNAEPAGERIVFVEQALATRLIRAIQLNGRIEVLVQADGRPDPEMRLADRGVSCSGVPSVPSRSPRVDLSVLGEPIPAAFLPIAARHWTPLAPIPLEIPWSRPQVETFVAYSPTSQLVAETIARSWSEYKTAGGKQEYPWKALVEKLLEQAERKNPSASPGFLHVDRVPSGWGLYRLGHRWYNEGGFPLFGPGGVYWDHTYAPIEPPEWAIMITVNDPEMYGLLSYLRAVVASDTLEVIAVAEGYARNVDLLLPAVFEKWSYLEDLSEELVQMLPLMVVFVGFYSMSRILILTKSPKLVALGWAILAILKAAGCLLEVTFYGSIALNAFGAGRELLLVRRDQDGRLDEFGKHHLQRAVVLIRKVLVDVTTIMVLKKGGTALKKGGQMGGTAAKSLSALGDKAGRSFREWVQTRYGPALAGAYGEGPSFDVVAMEGEAGGVDAKTSGGSRGKGGAREGEVRPGEGIYRGVVDKPPTAWKVLEAGVIEEFRRGVPKNGPNYFTSEKQQISAIWTELRAFVKKLRSKNPDMQDILANANQAVLDMTVKELIDKADPDLAGQYQAQLRWYEVRESQATRRAAAGDRNASNEARDWHELYVKLFTWLNTSVSKLRVDIFELNLSGKQVGVVDASLAWYSRLHNLKSRVYLVVLNSLLGWRGGTAMDVGNGMFQNRMFFGEGFETGEASTKAGAPPLK